MMIFNYIRVSTIEQNTERQLRDVVCDRVYEEKISGKDTNRPQLQAMLSNKLTTEQVAELNTLRKQGMPIARIAKQFKITRPTVYSYLRNEEK